MVPHRYLQGNREAGRPGGGGCIINLSSVAGLIANVTTFGDPAFISAGGLPGSSGGLLGGFRRVWCLELQAGWKLTWHTTCTLQSKACRQLDLVA